MLGRSLLDVGLACALLIVSASSSLRRSLPGRRCARASQDRPESFQFFKISTLPCTVRILSLFAHVCATAHAATCLLTRSLPADPCTPRRRSMWQMPRAVRIDLSALLHDHRALQIDSWCQSCGASGLTVTPGASACAETAVCAGDRGRWRGTPRALQNQSRGALKWLLVGQCGLVCVLWACYACVLCVVIIWSGCGSV